MRPQFLNPLQFNMATAEFSLSTLKPSEFKTLSTGETH
jgi:hypothetical protein